MKNLLLWLGLVPALSWTAVSEVWAASASASAAPPASTGFFSSLKWSWFDGVVVLWLLIGAWRGRKRGMSREWFDLLVWLIVLGLGILLADPLGGWLETLTHYSRLFCTLVVYVGMAALLTTIGGIFKRTAGAEIAGSNQQGDFFGRREFVFGMFAGTLRFACILLFALGLLHAAPFSHTPPPPRKPSIEDSSLQLPSWTQCQQAVFLDSLIGRWLEKDAPFLLLDISRPVGARWENLGGHRQDTNQMLQH